MSMKKKVLAAGLAVCMAAIMVTGMTLAYFTDTQSAKNTFTIGDVSIKLDEGEVTKSGDTWAFVDQENARTEDGVDYGQVYPGAELPKDPTVTNTGSNDCYVRVSVTHDVNVTLGKLGANWEKVGDYYYYVGRLTPEADTGALFEQVKISEDVDGETVTITDTEINVTAEALQADGFTYEGELTAQTIADFFATANA